ncbi:tetratricopeptide repeat-containing sensor histidine kinase [Maribacter polysaccharolyticus]|uniref:tetratricopeptide repeat-containing sensor histidine kinase n=1 Tax=Maribacter polysaccharolyticus TaxID=3020831 RepID=UPI00237FA422|nr:tetratricopeptide repeat protein [Maribacter polysaccharolyticus]MDE3742081.1 tetratricopeptide repeat protein [Maribacter polysaccharolyticus]
MNIKKTIVLFLIFCAPILGFAQEKSIDSLKNELGKHTENDTLRAALLIKLAENMTYSSPNEAFRYIEEAITISSKEKWIEGKAMSYRQKGNLFYVLADNLKALDMYQKALVLSQMTSNKQLESGLLGNLGNIHADLKEYDQALNNYRAYLATAQTLGSRADEIKALSNIAIIYNDTGKFDEGVSFLEKALALAKLEGNDLFIAAITNNLALAYKNSGQQEKALRFYKEAVDLAQGIDNKYIEASALNSIGKINVLLKKFSVAEKNANKALSLSKEIGAIEWESDSWQVLSQVYEHYGKNAEALKAYKEHVQLKDSVLSEEKKSELTRKEMQFQMERQEAMALEEIKRQQFVKNGYLVGAIFLALISIIAYVLYKRRRDAMEERKVAEFNAKVAETELKALRSQMNPHFIFNSLNAISDFISRNDMEQADDYLVKFAKLTRSILENSEKKWITLEEDLELMELYMQIETLRLVNKLTYRIAVSESIDPDNTLIPPLMLQPFIENSIWHGIAPKNSNGKIDIIIQKKGNMLLCVVEDNGIGRPKTSPNGIKKNPLGLKITANRIEIINKIKNTDGSIKLLDKKEGVRVEVLIPLEIKF